MAISIAAEQFGIKINSAYVRIEQVRHNRFEDGMECVARYYPEKPDDKMPAFRDFIFRALFDNKAGDPYAQAYVHMKTLPEFADAIDC